jgi:hypothetical protein
VAVPARLRQVAGLLSDRAYHLSQRAYRFLRDLGHSIIGYLDDTQPQQRAEKA